MLLSKSSLFNLHDAAIMEQLQVTCDMCFSLMISFFLTVQEQECIGDSNHLLIEIFDIFWHLLHFLTLLTFFDIIDII